MPNDKVLILKRKSTYYSSRYLNICKADDEADSMSVNSFS